MAKNSQLQRTQRGKNVELVRRNSRKRSLGKTPKVSKYVSVQEMFD